ncbi:hypothetical protein GCM10027176_15930 [Actinoallomurus bryophytorum]|uniref:Uncharacterized protein n=1 Tax=Actinoallomurus bryophytorum TaxID=1490222 RepID=A0A543CNF9_9ACTN|nr:hypothetical protein [Actinoallomurus bryophytorum]TQL98632.1 hypothetical protein FB559_4260 [Actinoallomurus bryophytorum]
MRRLASIVVAVALACAAVALQGAHWSYERAYGPFVENGRIGRTLTEPRFTIRVEQVQTARSIRVPEGPYGAKPQIIPAGGVFAVVIATVAARRSPVYVASATLHTAYGDYYPTDKLGGGILSQPLVTPLSYLRFQPGMPRRGVYLFDVPARALAGARLYVSDRDTEDAEFGFYRNDPVRFSDEAHVDLGISAADAVRLDHTAAQGYGLPGPS